MKWKTFPIRLEHSEHITPHIMRFIFQRADNEAFEYKPGQFINIHFEANGAPTHRSYSVANPPATDGHIEYAISPVENGLATELLFGLNPGDVIDASGPYGRFVLRDDEPCRYILAGTGTGITPYCAMLPQIRERIEQGFEFDLLLGVWNRDELLYGEQFMELAHETDRFRFNVCYSRAMPDNPGSHERKGYVQKQFSDLDLNPETDIFYLCGNPDMIDDAMVMLRGVGFPTKNLRREKYLPAKQ